MKLTKLLASLCYIIVMAVMFASCTPRSISRQHQKRYAKTEKAHAKCAFTPYKRIRVW